MRIGLIQQPSNSTAETNIKLLKTNIADVAQQGAELIVLQELHNTPYFCCTEDVAQFDLAEPIPGPTTAWLGEMARQYGIVIVASLFERRAPGLYHNTAVVIERDGSIAGRQRKMHIPDDPGYYEKFYFTPARLMALQGAELLVYPTAIGYDTHDTPEEQQRQRRAWQLVQRGHAVANGLHVVAVNRVGTEPLGSTDESRIRFWGTSFVCGPQGEILAEAPEDNAANIVIDIDMQRSEQVRRWWPFLRDRRIEAYADITRRYID